MCIRDRFYKGNLRNGDVLESEASIVVIGDVDCGARVSAKGNIIILGTLKGTAQAGLSGNRNAVVVAMEMAPSQVTVSYTHLLWRRCVIWSRSM